jgi:hypothetical protein
MGTVRPLDFLVIGAAKSGTTTLFHYLRGHPRIVLPAAKEVPFFSSDALYSRGWAAVAAEHLPNAPGDARIGKITPRYLGDVEVPARLFATMPDVKLLALLRNPIDRAFSKYRLLVRKEREPRSFADAVREQLEPAALDRARTTQLPLRDSIVVRGEYARLLETYLAHFPRNRLLVHYTEELEQQPQRVLDEILDYLGLEPGWTPANLGERYYVGGERQRWPGLVPAAKRWSPLVALWRRVPTGRRNAMHLWYNRQFNVVADEPMELPDDVRAALVAFYRADVERLGHLVGRPAPWPEFRADG